MENGVHAMTSENHQVACDSGWSKVCVGDDDGQEAEGPEGHQEHHGIPTPPPGLLDGQQIFTWLMHNKTTSGCEERGVRTCGSKDRAHDPATWARAAYGYTLCCCIVSSQMKKANISLLREGYFSWWHAFIWDDNAYDLLANGCIWM